MGVVVEKELHVVHLPAPVERAAGGVDKKREHAENRTYNISNVQKARREEKIHEIRKYRKKWRR